MRRSLEAGLLATLMAALAILFGRPPLLGATVTIGALLLARQYWFLRTLSETVGSLSVEQKPQLTGTHTGDSADITFAVSRAPTPLALELEPGLPTAVTVDSNTTAEPTLELEPGTPNAERTVPVTCHVTGRHTFDPARLTATDGWFRETLPVGPTPTMLIEPRGPRNVHVGSGGDHIALAQGQHASDRRGSGLVPTELREYVPSDTADRIDWKATARLGTPHVREYRTETDRPTLLVVDHRTTLATGPPDETELDYLRETALAVATSARRFGDPLGLLTVGDDGTTTRIDPAVEPAQYRRIRQQLLDLEPTTAEPHRSSIGGDGGSTTGSSNIDDVDLRYEHEPTDARSALRALERNDATDFERTLRPFYATRRTYRERFVSEPLYRSLQTVLNTQEREPWTILCTDDSEPTKLRKTIRLVREHGNRVLVLLAPRVLFESESLADLDRTYDRYLSFEEFRRSLDRIDGVTTLEVAPGDRLATVLADGRDRARTTASGGHH
ncbi:DUF58 domain-containing protein [Halopiger djelfimassiliensis]|uniref:DUF58 domain-containing protein n=1 Tax=Halopiger djelfimassiliensis TaxID=1293047 RepID=UPI002DDB7286|nr:DUF58 domain-containing protein [Halopiger djelfimassiliensis]